MNCSCFPAFLMSNERKLLLEKRNRFDESAQVRNARILSRFRQPTQGPRFAGAAPGSMPFSLRSERFRGPSVHRRRRRLRASFLSSVAVVVFKRAGSSRSEKSWLESSELNDCPLRVSRFPSSAAVGDSRRPLSSGFCLLGMAAVSGWTFILRYLRFLLFLLFEV